MHPCSISLLKILRGQMDSLYYHNVDESFLRNLSNCIVNSMAVNKECTFLKTHFLGNVKIKSKSNSGHVRVHS